MFYKLKKEGFTLLELVIVISLLSFLFILLITVLNPGQRISSAYDIQRKNDVQVIYKAIQQYYIDNGNYNALNLSNTPQEICNSKDKNRQDSSNLNCDNYTNLSALVPVYLVAIPTDPEILYEQRKNSSVDRSNGYIIYKKNQSEIVIESLNINEGSGDSNLVRNFNFNNLRSNVLVLIIIVSLSVVSSIWFILRNNKRY